MPGDSLDPGGPSASPAPALCAPGAHEARGPPRPRSRPMRAHGDDVMRGGPRAHWLPSLPLQNRDWGCFRPQRKGSGPGVRAEGAEARAPAQAPPWTDPGAGSQHPLHRPRGSASLRGPPEGLEGRHPAAACGTARPREGLS